MDFIERLFGLSPDGGSGATEAVVLVAIASVAALIVARWRRRVEAPGKIDRSRSQERRER